MEFRLTYEGELLPSTNRDPHATHKHSIRKAFHPQLKRLWEINSPVAGQIDPMPSVFVRPPLEKATADRIEVLAKNFSRNGYQFVPLVTEELGLLCGIEILFLRPEPPGRLVQSGDIDNRIKTLLDALRMPSQEQELGDYKTPESDETPFFCLLEDDRLVTRIEIETDTLLEPLKKQFANPRDARLVIKVKLKPSRLTWENIGYA